MTPEFSNVLQSLYNFLIFCNEVVSDSCPKKVGAFLVAFLETNPDTPIEIQGHTYTPRFIRAAANLALGTPIEYKRNKNKEVCGIVFKYNKSFLSE